MCVARGQAQASALRCWVTRTGDKLVWWFSDLVIRGRVWLGQNEGVINRFDIQRYRPDLRCRSEYGFEGIIFMEITLSRRDCSRRDRNVRPISNYRWIWRLGRSCGKEGRGKVYIRQCHFPLLQHSKVQCKKKDAQIRLWVLGFFGL